MLSNPYVIFNNIITCFRRRGGNLIPFTYEWIDSGYVLALMGQIGKIKNRSYKGNGSNGAKVAQSVFLMH